MPKLLSFIKKKKIILGIFSFSLAIILIIPQTAFASWYNPTSWYGDVASGAFNAIVGAFLMLPLLFSALFADILGVLLKGVLGIIASVSYTKSPAVNIGWPIVQQLANMMIVLGFVVIGIATALRIKEYEAKQLLTKLIVVALLVNFSLLICGVIIDGSNILTNLFFSKVKNMNWASASITTSFGLLDKPFTTPWTVFAPVIFSSMIFNFAAGVTYFLYLFLLLARVVAIWMLVILSPLAFVCRVFPATKKVWDEWWSNFIQWCLVGIPAGLFYYIGSKMIDDMTKGGGSALSATGMGAINLAPDTIIQADTITILTNGISTLIPGLFLIVGFFISLKFSAMGGKAITAFATKSGKKLMSAGNELSSRTPVGRDMRERFAAGRAQLAAATGFAKVGEVERVRAAGRKGHRDAIKDQTDDQINAKLTKSGGRGLMGAALIEEATERKILTKGRTTDQVAGLLANAGESGSKTMRDDATKLDTRLAAYDHEKVNKILQAYGPGVNMKNATSVQMGTATGQAVREATAKQSNKSIVEMNPDAYKDVNVQSGLNAAKIKAIGRSGRQEPIDNLSKLRAEILATSTTPGTPETPEYRTLRNNMIARGIASGSPAHKQIMGALTQIGADPNFN